MLVVELVVPLQDQLTGSERLGGRLGGGLEEGLGLAELPGEVAGARRLRGAQSGGTQDGVNGGVAGGGGLEALVRALCFLSGGEDFVQRGAAGEEGPRRGRGRRDDGVVRVEGHPAARDVFGGESDRREGVSELDGRGDQSLERRWGRWALCGRGWDGFRF